LTIRDVDGLAVTDIAAHAMDAEAPGESSIAVIVATSTNISLARVLFTAGTGADGADGELEPFSFDPDADLDGNEPVTGTGGAEKECACPSGATSVGGRGGDPGQPGADGEPDFGAGHGGLAGSSCTLAAGEAGATDAAGAMGRGAALFGIVTEGGWLPEHGSDGKPGSPGQGGGGAGSRATNIPGAGGACGGCGGNGGGGGRGGGGSIALLVFESGLELRQSELRASAGGSGGKGATGQAGQEGGLGAGNVMANACLAGDGGTGATGGPGGGGAGGVSIALVAESSTIERDDATSLAFGTAGARGPGGSPGTNDGVDGIARGSLTL
jgi:hypothetical protein